MVKIPYIKIPSVRVGIINPTSNIGTGGATPAPPIPITYLTQWKIVGNSEVHTLPYPDGIILPNGYKRCEYLASDGVAYIEVPFGFYKTDEVYAKAAMLDITHADKYFISPKVWNDNFNRFGLGTLRKTVDGVAYFMFAISYGGSGGVLEPNFVADIDIHEWEYKNYVASVGDSSKNVSSIRFDLETQNLRLFCGYNTPTECKIYEYRHKKADAEYRLIPCLDSNDTPCMYDVINNQTYYNSASSGSFTYELYPQPTEIWSCGEYNATDGKWHILVQPLGGSIADIALTEPLRKVNDVADTIEFPSDTEGKALVTRTYTQAKVRDLEFVRIGQLSNCIRFRSKTLETKHYSNTACNILFDQYICMSIQNANATDQPYVIASYVEQLYLYCPLDITTNDKFNEQYGDYDIVYELATPTTELVDAPQIAEAGSYTCVISQGAKAVEWSSFTTNSE